MQLEQIKTELLNNMKKSNSKKLNQEIESFIERMEYLKSFKDVNQVI